MIDPQKILFQWADSRRKRRHKYEAGYLLAVVGSETYPGAAVLSATAAVSSCVGGLIVFGPASIASLILAQVPEAIFVSRPTTDAGHFIRTQTAHVSAVLIGSGLEETDETAQLIRDLVFEWDKPAVVDAGGLAVLSPCNTSRKAPWLLTPHFGEYTRLCGQTGLLFDLPDSMLAIQFCQEWNTTLLLKGNPSHVYSSFGHVYHYPQSHHVATTAGCGDVLAGLCGSFLAQGLGTAEAAAVALYIANKAGENASFHHRLPAVRAKALVDHLPDVLAKSIE